MNREHWLEGAVICLNDLLKEHCEPKPCRVSCGFPGGGSPRKRIGEAWSTRSATDGIANVFISPVLDDGVRVLDVLLHELIHVADDCLSGHKGEFKRIANAVGLTGKMTATVAGPELEQKLQRIAAEIGAYPHGALCLNDRKKQTTRMLKVSCHCGFIARASKSVIETWQDGDTDCPLCGTTLAFD